jgi:hypothetical protein
MRLLALGLATLFVCTAPVDINAHDKLMKVGTFKIDASGEHQGSFVLDDGNLYKPTSRHQRRKTTDWQLGDSILVMSSNHSNRFVLVNTRTNQKVKARAISVDSSSL